MNYTGCVLITFLVLLMILMSSVSFFSSTVDDVGSYTLSCTIIFIYIFFVRCVCVLG